LASEVLAHFAWDYDDALVWMHAARDRVRAGGAPSLGYGCHDRVVVSLGRNTPEADVLALPEVERASGIVRRIERGGGATIHGPGQVVVYPVIELVAAQLDVPRLTDALETSVVEVLDELGLVGVPGEGRERGVYVGGRKIASVGFRVERGVVTHGLAFNVSNDLEPFGWIATCGVRERPMTSVARELDSEKVPLREIAEGLALRVSKRCVIGWHEEEEHSVEPVGGRIDD
jgi:lipoate-protein ligase B